VTISLSNSVIPANAPQGAVIGTLSCRLSGPVQYVVLYSGGLPLLVSGNKLETAWAGTESQKSYTLWMVAKSTGFSMDYGILSVTVIAPTTQPTKIVGDPSTIYDQPLPKGD
jgi:hypothetical protein